jgi:integral membrane protein
MIRILRPRGPDRVARNAVAYRRYVMQSTRPRPAVKLSGALLRYRIMALVTGTLLVVLVFVAVPLNWWAHEHGPVAVVGTLHGFLFMIYLVTALDLGVRRRWPLLKLGLVMIAGTIPFASFVAERKITREIKAISA